MEKVGAVDVQEHHNPAGERHGCGSPLHIRGVRVIRGFHFRIQRETLPPSFDRVRHRPSGHGHFRDAARLGRSMSQADRLAPLAPWFRDAETRIRCNEATTWVGQELQPHGRGAPVRCGNCTFAMASVRPLKLETAMELTTDYTDCTDGEDWTGRLAKTPSPNGWTHPLRQVPAYSRHAWRQFFLRNAGLSYEHRYALHMPFSCWL